MNISNVIDAYYIFLIKPKEHDNNFEMFYLYIWKSQSK